MPEDEDRLRTVTIYIRQNFPETDQAITNADIGLHLAQASDMGFTATRQLALATLHLFFARSNDIPGETMSLKIEEISRSYVIGSGRPAASFWQSTEYGRLLTAERRMNPSVAIASV